MRGFATLSFAAAVVLAIPTAAISCGGQATGANASPMCGGMTKTAATNEKPMSAAPQQQAAGGCCCMKMAAMPGMDGKPATDPQSTPNSMPDMPGMEAPKPPAP